MQSFTITDRRRRTMNGNSRCCPSFCVVTPCCSLVNGYQPYGRTFCLHLLLWDSMFFRKIGNHLPDYNSEELWRSSLCIFLRHPFYPLFLWSNYSPQHFVLIQPQPRSSHRELTVSYVLIFRFFDSRWKHKYSKLNGGKYFQNWSALNFINVINADCTAFS
jgi:hypothetical protein